MGSGRTQRLAARAEAATEAPTAPREVCALGRVERQVTFGVSMASDPRLGGTASHP